MMRSATLARRLAAGLVILIIAVVIGLATFSSTDTFKDMMRTRVVAYLNKNLKGHFTLSGIEGFPWRELTLRGISIEYGGKTIVSIPSARLRYSLFALLRGTFMISRLSIEKPKIDLVEDAKSGWNLLAALSERQSTPPEGISGGSEASFSASISHFAVHYADVSIIRADGSRYKLPQARLDAHGRLGAATVLVIDSLDVTVLAPNMPQTSLRGALALDDSKGRWSLEIEQLTAETRNSRLLLTGQVRDLATLASDLTLSIPRLAASDVDAISPELGLAHDLSGEIRLTGDRSALHARLVLGAGTMRANGQAQVSLTGDTLGAYSAELSLDGLELDEFLRPSTGRSLPAGDISAKLTAEGHGTALAALVAQARVQDRGVVANGLRLGDMTLEGSANEGIVSANAELANGRGRASLKAKLNLRATPTYEFALVASRLDAAVFMAKQTGPASDLNLRAQIEGTGTDPSSMRAHASVRMMPSLVGAIEISQGNLDARVANGLLILRRFAIDARGASFRLAGDFGVARAHRGHLRYALASANLAPWLALAGYQGNGRLRLRGDAAGNQERVQWHGSGEFEGLVFGRYSVRRANLDYDVTSFVAKRRLVGNLRLGAADPQIGARLRSLRVSARMQATSLTQTVDILLQAEDWSRRNDQLAGHAEYQSGSLTASVNHLALATANGTWTLQQPASLELGKGAARIHNLILHNGEESISVDGHASLRGPQDLNARINALELADLSAMMPDRPAFGGAVSGRLVVGGSASAPTLRLDLAIERPRVAGSSYQQVTTTLTYAADRAAVTAIIEQDATHSLQLRGAVPLAISWERGFDYRPTGVMSIAAHSDGIDLRFLDALSPSTVQKIGGTLMVNVSVQGDLNHPAPQGTIRLSDGSVFIKPLNVEYRDVSMVVTLTPQMIHLAELQVRAEQGSLHASGRVALSGVRPGATRLTVESKEWPAILTEEYHVITAGRIDISGPLSSLHVNGDAKVLGGTTIKPDIRGFERQSIPPDHTIQISKSWSPPHKVAEPPTPPNPIYEASAIDVRVTVLRDTWVKVQDSAVELQGTVRVQKAPHKQPVVEGAIDTVHGRVVVANRIFNVTRGKISFTGGREINPELGIAAQTQVNNYRLTATVGGTVNQPSLALSSTPALDQADILSMMMFGSPVNRLNSSQQAGLQRKALSVAKGFAAAQIGQSVANALGLESLGLSAGSSGVGVGHYITQNAYVSAHQETTTGGHQASFTYYLTPDIQLQTSTSTDSGNQIELQWQKNY